MKKIILLSITVITTICICAFKPAPTFQYELRNLILEGNFIDSGNGAGSQKISIVIGIVGEPYDFVKTNTFNVRLETSKSIDANKATLQISALNFIATNYPDK